MAPSMVYVRSMKTADTKPLTGDYAASRVLYAAGAYDHAPQDLLELRLVRRG